MRMILLMVAALASTPTTKEIPNYCHDPESEAWWTALRAQAPGDVDVEELYDLRTRLCTAIGDGTISAAEGAERFAHARDVVLEKKRREYEQQLKTEPSRSK